MIDFKVKGTKLPRVPEGTKYQCTHWHGDRGCLDLGFSYDNWVSYGVTMFDGVEYILAEKPEYHDHSRLYMISTSDVERLAAEQGMVITELPKYWAVKCDMSHPDWMNVITYLNTYGSNWTGKHPGSFYGYDGGPSHYGTNWDTNLSSFHNNPTLITIGEFMKLTNKLPKNWVVQCDTTNPNWAKVINYLHEIHGEKWSGHMNGSYYGYDGGSEFKGTNTGKDLSRFSNNPTVLTIEEFVQLTKQNTEEMAKSTATLTELPEYWVVKQDQNNPGWKKVIKYLNDKSGYRWDGDAYNYYGTEPNCAKGVNCYDNISNFLNNPTLLTIEEFLRLTNQKPETMITIKREQLQEIHDIACSTWKEKIKDIAKEQPFGDIRLADGTVDEMFKAATSTQSPVLEKIFGKQNKIDMEAVLNGIEVRKNHNLAGVSFFLPYDYTWKIVSDDTGVSCLVPTRK